LSRIFALIDSAPWRHYRQRIHPAARTTPVHSLKVTRYLRSPWR